MSSTPPSGEIHWHDGTDEERAIVAMWFTLRLPMQWADSRYVWQDWIHYDTNSDYRKEEAEAFACTTEPSKHFSTSIKFRLKPDEESH